MSFTDTFQYATQRVTCCLLCPRPATRLGVFIPEAPALWPGPPLQAGKVRSFWYGLCKQCFRRTDKEAAVEAALLYTAPDDTDGDAGIPGQ